MSFFLPVRVGRKKESFIAISTNLFRMLKWSEPDSPGRRGHLMSQSSGYVITIINITCIKPGFLKAATKFVQVKGGKEAKVLLSEVRVCCSTPIGVAASNHFGGAQTRTFLSRVLKLVRCVSEPGSTCPCFCCLFPGQFLALVRNTRTSYTYVLCWSLDIRLEMM